MQMIHLLTPLLSSSGQPGSGQGRPGELYLHLPSPLAVIRRVCYLPSSLSLSDLADADFSRKKKDMKGLTNCDWQACAWFVPPLSALFPVPVGMNT